jgi:TRAP-type transport system periplasmic protein
MSAPRKLLMVIALISVFALLLAACGDDDDVAEPAPDDEPDVEEPEEEEPAEDPVEVEGDDVTLVFGHYQPGGETTVPEERFAELIEEYTGGTVTVEIHFAEALGGAGELIFLVSEGAMDMAAVVPAFTPDAFPVLSITQMPWWTAGDDEVDLRRQHDLIMELHPAELIAQELEENFNVRRTMTQNLPPYYLIGNDPECSLDGIAGDQVRSLGADYPRMLEAAGAVPVSMVTAEIYESLERGALDRASLPADNILDHDMHEVAQYACGPIWWLGAGHQILMNIDTWESLSPDQQDAIERAAADAQEFSIEFIVDRQEDLLDRMAENMEVNSFPEGDLEEWIEATPDFAAEWLERMQEAGHGEGAQEIYDKMREIEAREY